MFAGVAFSISILIGTAQAYYGPAIPSLRRQFEISAATAGTALGAHFLGAVLGAVFWGVLEHRITRRT
jgi:predicted MFS family arabinose efflux permease